MRWSAGRWHGLLPRWQRRSHAHSGRRYGKVRDRRGCFVRLRLRPTIVPGDLRTCQQISLVDQVQHPGCLLLQLMTGPNVEIWINKHCSLPVVVGRRRVFDISLEERPSNITLNSSDAPSHCVTYRNRASTAMRGRFVVVAVVVVQVQC